MTDFELDMELEKCHGALYEIVDYLNFYLLERDSECKVDSDNYAEVRMLARAICNLIDERVELAIKTLKDGRDE